MDELGHKENFELSPRVQTRVGGTVDDAQPGATLHGDAGETIDQVHR